MSNTAFVLLVFIIVAPGLVLAGIVITDLQRQVAQLTEALRALTRPTITASTNPPESVNKVDLTAAKTATKARKPRAIRGAR